MRVRSKAILAAVAALAIASGACGKVGNLQARKAFKEANGLYQAQDYREAAAKYQEVLASDPNFMTPDGVTPYFFIANSYDNLYKPARKGEAENDAYVHYYSANAYVLCGRRQEAIRQAALAIKGGVVDDIHTNPDLRPLLSEPSLRKLLAR